MLCLKSLKSKGRGERTEQSDIEVIVLKKKGKESLNEPVSKAKANEFLKFISTASIALLSNYISYQLRFSCYR